MENLEQFGQAVVDALAATIAVIEQDGTIRAVNEAWKRFARENRGSRDVTSTGVGVNYLEVCRKARGAFAEEAPPALIGIEHVLQGKQASFQLEYPCHSPTERRWFLMSVTPLKQSHGAVIAHLNITERKLAEEAVQRSEARVRRLIESNILGIFFWRDGQITEANEIFLQMLGYTRQELLTGKLLWNDLTPKKFKKLDQKAIVTMRRFGALPLPYEKEFFRKDGSRLPVLIGAAFVDQVQQEGVAFVLDISERKELERQKDDFFSMVSHELKTPLSSMWILTGMLNKQLMEQGFRDVDGNLVQLGTQAKQLMKLLTDVLEVSQLQAGYLLYTEEAFDMNALVREVVTVQQQASPDHAIVIIGTIDKPLRGDRDRLGQVLTNLLTNAIKYSVGTDPIEVLLASTDDQLTIRVRDYGIGIPTQEQGRVFAQFYRVQYGRQGSFPGFGLGLHISQKIIERHEGTIKVESVEEKGSTFTIMLPFRK